MNKDKGSEAAEGATSTTSGISKKPINHDQAPASNSSVATTPAVGENDGTGDESDSEALEAGVNQPPGATRGPGRPAKINPDKLIMLSLDKISSHQMNKLLFGEHSSKEIDALANSLAETTQLTPLVVTPHLEKPGHYTLLSGHKRKEAMTQIGWQEALVQIVDVKDEDGRLVRLLEFNRHHVPNREQTIRIYMVYLQIESKKAKARQVTGAQAKTGDKDVETLPPPADEVGKARDIAAAKVGLSGVTAEKGRKVIEAADGLRKTDAKTADELLKLLNDDGYEPALSRLKALGQKTLPVTGGNTGGDSRLSSSKAKAKPEAPDGSQPPTVSKAESAKTENESQQDKMAAPDAEPDNRKGSGAAAEDEDSGQDQYALAFIKSVDDLEKVSVPDLTADLKRNLVLADERATDWFANHGEMLQAPGHS